MIDQFVLDELEQALDEKAKPLLELALAIDSKPEDYTALTLFFTLKEIYDQGVNDGKLGTFSKDEV